MRFGLALFPVLTATCLSLSNVSAADFGWPARFGPHANSIVPDSEARGIPATWDESTGTNIVWKVALPEHGHSTPAIRNGRVWLTSASEDGTKQYIDCLDSTTGEQLHHRLLFENEDPEPLNNPINTYASPTCIVTDDAVFVHFGSYGTARIDPQTINVVWERRDIECRHYRGPGSSPLLHDNLLILTFDGIDAQFLMGLDATTGENVWRTARTTDYGDLDENGQPKREGDLRKAYSTPGITTVDGRAQVVSVGSRAAFAYDVLTGKELWTLRHDDYNAAAPPLFFENLVILNTGSSGANLVGIDLNETTRGDITDSHVVWDKTKGNSRLAAPVLFDDRVFMVTHAGAGVCVDAASGKELKKTRIGGTFVSSPLIANGLVYVGNEDGIVVVFRADESMEIVAKNKLSAGMRASPAAAGGKLYLRTLQHLYCISEQTN